MKKEVKKSLKNFTIVPKDSLLCHLSIFCWSFSPRRYSPQFTLLSPEAMRCLQPDPAGRQMINYVYTFHSSRRWWNFRPFSPRCRFSPSMGFTLAGPLGVSGRLDLSGWWVKYFVNTLNCRQQLKTKQQRLLFIYLSFFNLEITNSKSNRPQKNVYNTRYTVQ